MEPDEKILTLNETMERLRIGRTALRRLINKDPDFKTLKLGHRRVISERALNEYIRKKEAA